MISNCRSLSNASVIPIKYSDNQNLTFSKYCDTLFKKRISTILAQASTGLTLSRFQLAVPSEHHYVLDDFNHSHCEVPDQASLSIHSLTLNLRSDISLSKHRIIES